MTPRWYVVLYSLLVMVPLSVHAGATRDSLSLPPTS